jgi:hypothetical protein
MWTPPRFNLGRMLSHPRLMLSVGGNLDLSMARLGMADNSSSVVTYFLATDDPLRFLGSMETSPSMTVMSSLLNGYVLVHSMGAFSPPPSFGNLAKLSFRDNVQSSSNNLMVHEAMTIIIPLMKDVVSKAVIYSSNAPICWFINLWPLLVDLHKWILDFGNPRLKEKCLFSHLQKHFYCGV